MLREVGGGSRHGSDQVTSFPVWGADRGIPTANVSTTPNPHRLGSLLVFFLLAALPA